MLLYGRPRLSKLYVKVGLSICYSSYLCSVLLMFLKSRDSSIMYIYECTSVHYYKLYRLIHVLYFISPLKWADILLSKIKILFSSKMRHEPGQEDVNLFMFWWWGRVACFYSGSVFMFLCAFLLLIHPRACVLLSPSFSVAHPVCLSQCFSFDNFYLLSILLCVFPSERKTVENGRKILIVSCCTRTANRAPRHYCAALCVAMVLCHAVTTKVHDTRCFLHSMPQLPSPWS